MWLLLVGTVVVVEAAATAAVAVAVAGLEVLVAGLPCGQIAVVVAAAADACGVPQLASTAAAIAAFRVRHSSLRFEDGSIDDYLLIRRTAIE